MKIIIPYAGNFPTQAVDGVASALSQVTAYMYREPTADPELDQYTEYVGGSDSAYFELLARLWHMRESFIVVEHDVIVTEAAIAGLIECPNTWCSCPYPWYDRTLHGLGCTKFDAQIMQDLPELFDVIASDTNDLHPAKHWCNIDARMRRYLNSYMRNDHLHTTLVKHLRPYASHGCVPNRDVVR